MIASALSFLKEANSSWPCQLPRRRCASWQGQSWAQAEGTSVDWILKNKQPYVVRDLAAEQAFEDFTFAAQEGVRATVLVPLLAGGAGVGVFFLDSLTPGAYSAQDVELVQPVAQQLALAIDNTRLFQDIEEKSRQIEIANKHKSQFLANMSHELRTLVQRDPGYTELIQDNIYGEVPEAIGNILARVDKMGGTSSGSSTMYSILSKIEAGPLNVSQ